jgi:serine/threonine protein kinase
MDNAMNELIPANFTCPITHEAFDDPVVAIDGHTYSRAAIQNWFSSRQTSPLTNERLESTQLLPNHTLRNAIEEWRGKQPLPIDPQRIHLTEEVLGQGSFGRVVAGTLNIGGGRVIRVAVKSMPDMTAAGEREAFQRELKAHIHAVRHCDGICKLCGTYELGNRLSLVMKMYEGGSLDKKIRDGTLDADKICRYAHVLCSALRQLHACGLLVRDIKPPNILFDSFDQPVLADFGIAVVVSTATRRHNTSMQGTLNYMAPETFLDARAGGPGIGTPADVWAMACVVVEMHTRKVPWDGMNMGQIIRVVSVDYRAPAVPETAPAHALLGRCFLPNPVDRPSAGDLADAFAPPPTSSVVRHSEDMDSRQNHSWTPSGRNWKRIAFGFAVLGMGMTIVPWCVYLPVQGMNQQANDMSGNSTVEMTPVSRSPISDLLSPLSPSSPVDLPKTSCVNGTEEKIVEKIVHVEVPGPERIVEVPGPERIVYRDKIVEKIVQVNHTVEKMVEVPKIIFVEKNLTEGTVCTCKAGYYSSTAGARF